MINSINRVIYVLILILLLSTWGIVTFTPIEIQLFIVPIIFWGFAGLLVLLMSGILDVWIQHIYTRKKEKLGPTAHFIIFILSVVVSLVLIYASIMLVEGLSMSHFYLVITLLLIGPWIMRDHKRNQTTVTYWFMGVSAVIILSIAMIMPRNIESGFSCNCSGMTNFDNYVGYPLPFLYKGATPYVRGIVLACDCVSAEPMTTIESRSQKTAILHFFINILIGYGVLRLLAIPFLKKYTISKI